jgi:predicted  nucleic acid-binding Zn-ribbon protein
MTVPELALRHQRLDQRTANVRSQIERLRAALSSDPVTERLIREHDAAEALRRDLELRIRDREREAEARRTRLRSRERELMSGRVRNPTELMKLNEEVEHLKVAVTEQEDAELEVMEAQEHQDAEVARLAGELAAARERSAVQTPELEARLARLEDELPQVEAERDEAWGVMPPDWQSAYRRVRLADPVAEVVRGHCQACRVTVTSSGMQVLRRAGLVMCDNCGRLLVVA